MITVRSGDTLSGIASRIGSSVGALLAANPQIKNANLIYVGAQLNAPGYSPASSFSPAVTGSGSNSTPYIVKSGDSLSAIGARFGVSYQAIAAANGIANPNLISVGQRLTIPGKSGGAPTTPAPAAQPTRYTVRSGDSLSAIGARFGVSYQSIAAANGIANPNHISVGQVLTIPGKGVSGPAPVINPGPSGSGKGVTVQQLQAIMPDLSTSRAQQVLPYLNQAMLQGGINTPLRQAAFLAQLATESGQFRWFEELASGAAYEGRADLGNTQPGDGVRFKGRGPIQLTGRSNYRAAGQALGIDLEGNPTRAADLDVGFRTAVWFWNSRTLNSYADVGNFDMITKRVNGGFNGKASRDAYYARAKSVLLGAA